MRDSRPLPLTWFVAGVMSTALAATSCVTPKEREEDRRARLEQREAEHGRRFNACIAGRAEPWPYFPEGVTNRLESCWYGDQLHAMGEPSLAPGATDGGLEDVETYRFLWLRTFHNPIAIRIERRGTEARLIGIRLDGMGGYAPGNVAARVERRIGADDWAFIARRLDAAGLWGGAVRPEMRGFDGADWIIEGVRGTQCAFASHWTTDLLPMEANIGPANVAFREAALRMLDLAGLRPDEIY